MILWDRKFVGIRILDRARLMMLIWEVWVNILDIRYVKRNQNVRQIGQTVTGSQRESELEESESEPVFCEGNCGSIVVESNLELEFEDVNVGSCFEYANGICSLEFFEESITGKLQNLRNRNGIELVIWDT